MPTGGPTLLGFDVIWIATILSFIATMADMLAIYAATTVRDPMARRVKALNERREQLKAGIVASTNKRKKLTNRNQAADRVRSNVRAKTSRIVGIVRGARVALEHILSRAA